MGTHPIFESDFDCLTDSQMSEDHDYDENGADMDVDYHQKKKKSKKDKKKKKIKHESNSDDDAYKKEYDDEDMKEEYASDSDYSSQKIEKIEVKVELSSDWDEKPKKKASKSKGSTKRKSTTNNGSASAKKAKKVKAEVKREPEDSPKKTPKKRVKKEEPPEERWEWWNEDPEEKLKREESGIKWTSLEHKGPLFPPEYTPLPKGVHMLYKGEKMKLEPEAEEVMTFYASMINTDYVTDPKKSELFNKNFFKDWKQTMTKEEEAKIKKLEHCDFTKVKAYQEEQREIRKNRSKEEKNKEKEDKQKIDDEYGFCMWDKHKEKIGNFRLEPPGLFRGRGEHPKMGRLKKRIKANEIIINCSKGSAVPTPPPGQKWKEVRHDDKVTWLACWIENVQGGYKYIMLGANSRTKGEKDWMKYEKARVLKGIIQKIRDDYTRDYKSKLMYERQRSVAMFFIDKLALRAGNEKDTDEAADTVGCCSLRVEHVEVWTNQTIVNQMTDKEETHEYGITFDFLGKDSMRYHNKIGLPKQVYKNVKLFMENKDPGDDLFDRLDTGKLNKHLQGLMDGLTAKVFRTYNASHCLQTELNNRTKKNQSCERNSLSVANQVLQYNLSNRAVAILCNHKKTQSKNFGDQMARQDEKINKKREAIQEAEDALEEARSKADREKLSKKLNTLQDQLEKLECAKEEKDKNSEIALGTSKLNYLDPRITVAWCRKHDVPIEKVYNKTQRGKFAWAIAMVDSMVEKGEEFQF